MLMKLILCDDDFEKSLKLRRLAALAFLGVGLIGFACYFLLVPGSSLSDYAQGFYLGAAGGITAGAVILPGPIPAETPPSPKEGQDQGDR